ncbi:MAG: hypothetical protein LBQ52_04870 [Helicobacteraceae bacterium]|jgi:hypothetical protein|nr:hypothetical protein [Helicobacteraceae bacterium]
MKGILFKEKMFKAVLRGAKTQTRRICPVQPLDNRDWTLGRLISTTTKENEKNVGKFYFAILDGNAIKYADKRYFFPKYYVDEIIYIKEPYTTAEDNSVVYKYSIDPKDALGYKWASAMFMPERLSRVFLKVSSIRIERLQTIKKDPYYYFDYFREGFDSPQDFFDYWDAINEKGHKWEDNPFVFVYCFERTEK